MYVSMYKSVQKDLLGVGFDGICVILLHCKNITFFDY